VGFGEMILKREHKEVILIITIIIIIIFIYPANMDQQSVTMLNEKSFLSQGLKNL